jgi:hypothetical protein
LCYAKGLYLNYGILEKNLEDCKKTCVEGFLS